MDSMGICKSPSDLELTIAVPGYGSLNTYSGASDGGSGRCNNRDSKGLVLLNMNHPTSGGEKEGSVEIMEERGGGSRRSKKLRVSKEQYQLLEETFRLNHTIEPRQREALAEKLKLRPRQVEIWFQNRRARSKLKNNEMECEYLRQCFGGLTAENRRLQREIEELRAARPPLSVVCPSCGRVVAAQPAAGAWATATSIQPSSSGSYTLQLCCPPMAL